MRLIDADSIKYHRTTECGGHGVFLDVDMVYKEEIDVIPTIDPESLRPHGKWVFGEFNGIGSSVYCSVCGNGEKVVGPNGWLHYGGHKFCGWCGAKMNGGENNG